MLYNKYQPKRIEDLTGQPSVKNFLKSLTVENRPNAIIFEGPSGTGKTSSARLVVQKLHAPLGKDGDIAEYVPLDTVMDYIEIDAASNSGVDSIRDIRERLRMTTWGSAPRVIYIDEAHNLSKSAWDALLKPIEDSGNNLFIFATTDAKKIPSTIKTRSVTFRFQEPDAEELKQFVISIAKKEGFELEEKLAGIIVFASLPSYRDVLTKLESVLAAFGEHKYLTAELVGPSGLLLSPGEQASVTEFLNLYRRGQYAALLRLIGGLENNESTLRNFVGYMYNVVRKGVLKLIEQDRSPSSVDLLFMEEVSELLNPVSYPTLTRTVVENRLLKFINRVRKA